MRGITLLLCLICFVWHGSALDRYAIRRKILLHRISISGHFDPFYADQAAKLRFRRQLGNAFADDEDLDGIDGSGDEADDTEPTPPPERSSQSNADWIWYRTNINFLDSIAYDPALGDYNTAEFLDVADKVMNLVENHLRSYISGYFEAIPLMFSMSGDDVIAMVDVGACATYSMSEITDAVRSLFTSDNLAPYRLSSDGFEMKYIGTDPERQECMPGPTLPTFAPASDDLVQPTATTRPLEPVPPDVFDPVRPGVTEPVPPDVTASTQATTTVRSANRPIYCRADQATCKNLAQCIDKSYLCDGTPDCDDGSDEPDDCSGGSRCDPTEFLCKGTGKCVQKTWRCDGDDDCGNGYDEQDCPTAGPDAACPAMHFMCGDGACVLSSYQCDGEKDCADASDEDGCSEPIVIIPPNRTLTAVEGEDIEMICEAVGIPSPIISWRVNWGNVPPPPRVTMSTTNGRGTLSIKKVKLSDQGAYTCEAINSQGGIFAVPDLVLTVEEQPAIIGGDELQREEPCPPGEFDTSNEPGMTENCKRCYCFGKTDVCRSSQLEFNEIGIKFEEPEDKLQLDLKPVEIEGGKPNSQNELNRNQIRVNDAAKELQLIDLSKRFLAAAHYWSLPAQFLGAKINSYGGTLEFSFSYNNSYNFDPKPTNNSDIILEGNGQTLVHNRDGPHPEPVNKHTASVELDEEKWKKADGTPATRGDMMNVLANISSILVRTVYDSSMISSGIGDIKMQVATGERSENSTSLPAGQIATLVEECECPEGYVGLSCETCDTGYIRESVGPFLGNCVRDPTSPALQLCDEGHTGPNCEECAEGYTRYLDGCTRYPSTECNVAGSIGMGIDQQCDCKDGCEGPRCDRCKPGFYFLSSDNVDGCISCFCMGVTDTCDSTTWNRTQVTPTYQGSDYFVLSDAVARRTHPGQIRYVERTAERRQPVATAQLISLPNDVYYWMLPEEFLGGKLTSYGGRLDYTVSYNQMGGAQPVSRLANVKITGNGLTLNHISDVHPETGRDSRYVVPIKEGSWKKSDGTLASREDLLLVLSNINLFLIRATYSDRMIESMITDLYLETAANRQTGRGRAFEVEQCSCPEGYTGLSCEECSPGYHRVSGDYLGTCRKCDCNGHSDECETATGVCQSCRHNTIGNNCGSCADGYYGDARVGSPDDCRPCPCPSVDGRTDRGSPPTCTMDRNGQPVCDRCPDGYEGNRCERCAPGYAGNPQVPGSTCRRQDSTCQCHPSGSVDNNCDGSGKCTCKPTTSGPKCDQCKPGFFHLSFDNEGGCLPCFCMGVTKECTSATYKRNKVSSDFSENYGGFSLVDRQRRNEITRDLEVLNDGEDLSHPRVDTLPRGVAYYWRLPEQYLGDKIVSYGGDFQYTITYTTYGSGLPTNDPDIILIGNDIVLFSDVTSPSIPVNEATIRSITFRENYWRNADGRPASREHLLMALADIEDLLIRATYPSTTMRSTLSQVSMETASESVLMTEPALEVEQCVCPDGYKGLSCEDCAPGFTRSAGGIYLGLCHSCQCNGHADSCNSETGVCSDCRDNTAGDHCDVCAPGYFGDATRGTSRDCRPCACPGTGDNSFSDTCQYDFSSNVLTCTACREGHTGTRCERCAEGYTGNPSARGGSCTRTGTPAPVVEAARLPQVTVSPKRVSAKEGQTVTLRCSITSTWRVTTTWRHTTKSLPSNAIISDNGQTLTLPSLAPSSVGTYECIATNRYGRGHDSSAVTITGEKPMITVRIEEPRRVTAQVGSDASFVCSGSSKMPAFIVTWMKKGGRLPLQRATDFDGILHITNLQLSDSGTYVCTGSNMYSIDRQSATLLVVEDNRVSRPTAVVTPSNQSVTKGEDAIFYCNTEGDPVPNVEWHRVDGRPMPVAAQSRGDMLMIPSASMRDRAMYACRASNEHGIAEATGALDVFDGSPPTVTVVTSEVTMYIGDDALLECDATGDPDPVFSWTQRGRTLLSNVRKEGKKLRITSAMLANRGTYQCLASNPFGEDIGYIRVSVRPKDQFKRPVCRTEPKEVTAYVGTNSTITCVVGGDPPPSVTWVREDGLPLHPNMKVEGKQLKIWDVVDSNAGSYVCVATNQAGASRSKMTLHVVQKDLPRVKILPSRYLKVQAGSSLSFSCVTNETDADVTWLRGSHQQFTGQTLLTENNRVLAFKNIGVEESGSYVCIASNVVGHREVSAYVEVTQPPSITISPARFVALREGESITLTCKASGKPVPSVIWKKLNASADGSSKMLTRYRLRSNKLIVRSAQSRDAGDYSCMAINEAGNSEQKAMIIVHPRVAQKAPTVTVESSTVNGVEGSEVQLRCVASGMPAPAITWSRVGQDLPEGSRQSEGILHIPHLSPDDVGAYTCQAVNRAGSDKQNVDVKIVVPPSLTVHPASSAALVRGQSMAFTCAAVTGTQPVAFEWTRETVEPSPSVLFSGSRLQVLEFVPERDSGTYTCSGTNDAGSSTTSLTLQEATPPVVNVSPREVTKLVGESVTLQCTASVTGATVAVETTWHRADGQDFESKRVQTTSEGELTISDLRVSDAADYECTATNPAGSSSVSASLVVHEPPTVTIHVIGDDDLVIGRSLKVSCNSTGVPDPEVTLLKDGESFKQNEFMTNSLNSSDSGVYTCVASNEVKSVEDKVTLVVHGPPTATVEPSDVKIRAHQSLSLSCYANATLEPNITWSKRDGNMSVNVTFVDNDLFIDDVTADDAGTYLCTATNKAGSAISQADVTVHSFIPFFSQTDRSYISHALTEGSFYTSFDITISFRPATLDGILLYALGVGSDFLSLSLAGGFVEFRFDVGSGPVTIRSSAAVEQGQWHTVTITRNGKMGELTLDDGETVSGKSPGEFRALDISSPLHIGGIPRELDNFLPLDLQSLGPDSGFYGCISQLVINRATLDMGSASVERVGIVRCKTCGANDKESPCEHNATCVETYKSKNGFVCRCGQGYVGEKCQFVDSEICAKDACGPRGSCEKDLSRELGYHCVCEDGYVGPRCTEATTTTTTAPTTTTTSPPFIPHINTLFDVAPEERKLEAKGLHLTVDTATSANLPLPSDDVLIDNTPRTLSFNQDSYIMTRSLKASQPHRTDIRLRIKRNSQSDGLILYNEDATDAGGVSSHFIALSIRSNILEYRFSSGSDVTVLQAPMSALGVGTWHTIRARRRRGRCRLDVDGRTVVRASTSGGELLAVNGPMFVGGVKFWDHIPERAHVRDGFDGCMEELHINNNLVPFDNRFTKKNTGVCDETSVEESPSTSSDTEPEQTFAVRPRYSARFVGTSYASFHKITFPHDGEAEQLSVSFRTSATDGLILFHGEDVASGADGREESEAAARRRRRGNDFISLGVQDSYLVYAFDLGGGRSEAMSSFPVSDGLWHKVIIVRRGTLALMWLDDLERPVATQSATSHTDANTPGRVYLGGAPDVTYLTAGHYTSGFVGCIKDVRFTRISAARLGDVGSKYLDDSASAALDFSRSGALERIGLRVCKPVAPVERVLNL